jgi:hypothetical protein
MRNIDRAEAFYKEAMKLLDRADYLLREIFEPKNNNAAGR